MSVSYSRKKLPGESQLRKLLSFGGLLELCRKNFKNITDPRESSKIEVSMQDTVTAGLSVFNLKFPSLLQFDNTIRKKPDPVEAHNFKTLFKVEKIPSDTSMRETLDDVETSDLTAPFSEIIGEILKGKGLDQFCFYRGSYLLSLDGTGFFSSKKVRCSNCCVKNHRDGTQTYYHQMLCGAFVHPDQKTVLPIAPEPIQLQDGAKKNDCERNAAKRLLGSIRQQFPRLDITITEDALSANAPHIAEIKKHRMHFILGVKPGDHKHFYERLEEAYLSGGESTFEVSGDGCTHRFKYINGIELKEGEPETTVNFLSYEEIDKNGRTKRFDWLTDFSISNSNAMKLMRGGRARWRIENEVFNTLKNQGYNFEHNYGHGEKNLASNFGVLMILAFLIDQASELCCRVYQDARERLRTKYAMWERMRSNFQMIKVSDWEAFFLILAGKLKIKVVIDSG